jgi:hypothetical protein
MQANTRSSSVKFSSIQPQQEQVFDEGYQRETIFTSTPAKAALYSICRRNSCRPTSLIALLNVLFLSIPLIFKSSRTITRGRCSCDLVFATMELVILCKVSLRILAIRICSMASFLCAFLRLFDPFFFLLCCLDVRFSAFKRERNALGFSKVRPSDKIASVLIPISMPITGPVACIGSACSSYTLHHKSSTRLKSGN